MESRTINSKRNIISGVVMQIVNIILPFVTRTAVLYVLGSLYAGLSGLFTSILQVLNLADLGFSTAVVYVLYKPIAEKNWDEVQAIVAFLRKTYKIVGLLILAAGGMLLPILPHLISGETPTEIDLYILYLIYLCNAVISYFFFAYKSALLTAMQRNDVVSNIGTITSICTKLVQLSLLIVTKNYYLFIIILPIGTFINNIFYQIYSKKLFPSIIPKGKMQSATKEVLSKQIRGIVFNRIGDVARNSFDNIILSSILGLTVVAIYNNYYLIYTSLYGVTLVIINAVRASVGNSIVIESVNKNYRDFRKFTFIFMWFSSWCTVCLYILFQPFMKIWMRGDTSLLLSNLDMILFCVYFYAITMNNTRNLYLEGRGLFWECRVWYLVEAFGNLLLNIILGYFWGVSGVLLATIITIFVFNFLGRNSVLFKYYFSKSRKDFYLDHFSYAATTIFSCLVTGCVCCIIPFNGWKELIFKAAICCIVPNIVFLGFNFKNSNFSSSLAFLKRIFHK